MAAEAIALLKDFYATGNPKGVLHLGSPAAVKLLSSNPVYGRAMSFLKKADAEPQSNGSSHMSYASFCCSGLLRRHLRRS